MKKLIKITVSWGGKDDTREFVVSSFEVTPLQNWEGLFVKLDDNYTFACKSIKVEQVN